MAGPVTQYRTFAVPVAGGMLHGGVWEPDRPDLTEPETGPTPTVLAVHGITASHLAWQWLADALPGIRIVAPDLRGRGRSGDLPGPTGMARHAEDLAALIAAAGGPFGAAPGPVPVVGHSMGGFVATALTAHRPDLVASLLLVDGGLPFPLPPETTVAQAIDATLGPAAERLTRTFPSREAYQAFWRDHPAFAGHRDDPRLLAFFDHDLDGVEPDLRPSCRPETMLRDAADLYRSPEQTAVLDAVVRAAVPVLFLRAPRDLLDRAGGLYPPELVPALAEALPGLDVREVDHTNHYTVVMTDAGATAVAEALRGQIGLRTG
ncbi:alpha/beta fold hydrolase [Nakamurella leprariae]|uniref:Alpha/beta hydrolase n=1 Tax=Nakamurella leprariae TaxID=2803911 RepID=A0A938YE09_9ACTN|nr:alpha/beta hydrolase [Nakamurella leprariae]MBM9466130.1 alpha/beta hydrolase [Nakamurella leprariae]